MCGSHCDGDKDARYARSLDGRRGGLGRRPVCRTICLSLYDWLRNTGHAVLHFGNGADIYSLKTPERVFTLYLETLLP
jgi:hypothetical protein